MSDIAALGRGEARSAPLLLTVLETARLLGVGRTTIYELISAGELEFVHIGRAARIPTSEAEAFVDRLRGQRAS